MKKRKAVLALLFAVILLVGVVPAEAAGQADFEVQTVEAAAGDTVDVAVSMKNNPGITSAKLKVTFGEGLTLEKVVYGDKLGGQMVQPKTFTSPVTLNWVNGLKDVSGDCLYATLTFRVAEDAVSGLCPVSLSYDPDDVFNVAYDNVAFAVRDGGVRIEGVEAPETEPTQPETVTEAPEETTAEMAPTDGPAAAETAAPAPEQAESAAQEIPATQPVQTVPAGEAGGQSEGGLLLILMGVAVLLVIALAVCLVILKKRS